MTVSVNTHQGLKDALDIFSTLNRSSDVVGAGESESTPFNELLAARQISLLDPQAASFQNLSAKALAEVNFEQDITQEGELSESEELLGEHSFLLNGELGIARQENPVFATLSKQQGLEQGFNGDSRFQLGQGTQASALERLAQHRQQEGFPNVDMHKASEQGAALLSSANQQIELTAASSETVATKFQSLLNTQSNDSAMLDMAQSAEDSGQLFTVGQARDRILSTAETKPITQFQVTENALTDPAWEKAVAARISWMGNQGLGNAVLRLNPQELGYIQIDLNMDGNQANIQFQTEQGDTSEMIERLLPRLQSAMESQGIKLDQVKVAHQPDFASAGFASSQEGAEQAQQQARNHHGGGTAEPAEIEQKQVDTLTEGQLDVSIKPGVDYYA